MVQLLAIEPDPVRAADVHDDLAAGLPVHRGAASSAGTVCRPVHDERRADPERQEVRSCILSEDVDDFPLDPDAAAIPAVMHGRTCALRPPEGQYRGFRTRGTKNRLTHTATPPADRPA